MAIEPAARDSWRGLDLLILTPVPTHPATLGNRVRIAEACRVLKAQGARITLLHYPTDEDWRSRLPLDDHAAMRAAFDDVHLVPVTRPLHSAPWPGPDHGIDEWWDPAIGTMLDWLFKLRRFDALLVNYTWLSRAFLHAPPGVLRILDTHDRFADRRALLAAHGIAPEFFFTTPEEEAAGIVRADLVWAIKAEEATHFRALGAREVVTVPHAETSRTVPMTAPGWRAGAPVLRLGIAGGRNTINAENIRAFLAVAREHLRRTLLPVEFVIAGSVCDLVSDLASPWVTLLGSVATMDELYGQVDAVLAPLAFSTGLKIKVGEALSRGKAVIGHAHAFEGYRVAHPFQACEDFTAMLRAIHAIAREPSLLDALEDASRETIARARQRLDRAVAHSGARARARRRSVAIVADTATLRPDSLVFDHLREAAAVLGASAVLEFRLIGDPALADAGCLRQLARHGPIRSGDDAADTVLRDTDAVLFAAIPDPLPADGLALGAAHLDVLALSASGAELTARLPALARGCGEFRLLGQDRSALAARILAAAADGPDPGRVRHIAAPFLAQNHESPLLRALHRAPADGVAVLAERGGAPELLAVLAFLVHGLRLRPTLYAADGIAPAFPPDGILALPAGALLRAAPRALFSPATYRLTRPRFVVEIGAAPGFAAAREVFSRSHIPMARLFDPLAPEEAMLRAEACARSRLPVSALLTLDHLAREADRFAPALGAEAERERGGQAGWGALLGMIAAGHGAG